MKFIQTRRREWRQGAVGVTGFFHLQEWRCGPLLFTVHMICGKWSIGVAKRLTLHSFSLHFSMLAIEILGRQLMHLFYPSIYFVGISLRFFIGFRWKKMGVLTGTTSQPFSLDWGYQFSFKGSQSISARPSCTKEQLILVLGQARGDIFNKKWVGTNIKWISPWKSTTI